MANHVDRSELTGLLASAAYLARLHCTSLLAAAAIHVARNVNIRLHFR